MNITVRDFNIKLSEKEKLIYNTPVSNKTETTSVASASAPAKPIVKPVVSSSASLTTDKNSTQRYLTSTASAYKVGFVMRKALSESVAQQDLEKIIESGECIFDKVQPDDVVLDLSNPSSWKMSNLQHIVSESGVGMYSLIFARCVPSGHHVISFNLDADFYNPGPNYLSAGDTPLPWMYFAFFVAFTAALGVWIWILNRDSAVNGVVHRIHYMMLILLALKCASLLFESIRYHYISIFGVSEMWSTVYYIFAFLKGVMLFTVILLIGSGWSLMKSYLNGQEKKIIFVVLVLQVLDNVAMIVLEESAPGSVGWLTWRDILHLVDIICCVAILLPIVWSIRHLRYHCRADAR